MSNDKFDATFGPAMRGSDDEYCSVFPLEGHANESHSVKAAPLHWVIRCSFCGHISSKALREQLAGADAPTPGSASPERATTRELLEELKRRADGPWRGTLEGVILGNLTDTGFGFSTAVLNYRGTDGPPYVVDVRLPDVDEPSAEGKYVPHRETYDENTLEKVHRALGKAGLHRQDAIDVINSLQNEGILFRERSPERNIRDGRGRLVTLQEFDD